MDHIDNPDMTVEESARQGQVDAQLAREFVGSYLAEHVDPEDLATTLRILECVAQMPLDRLRDRIETDGSGNPLYTYGNRMVWSQTQDIAETASHARLLLSRSYLEHRATLEDR